ncbi:MAG TPA: D-2-hydroxyacid dehydrogenase [Gammaproteobacteria bacterium]|nr:D-2-hydroxyacid dehydrogenase [Gammaproteobacteria bacterium]
MPESESARPVVAVLTAPDEGRPPGLEPLEAKTEIVHATDADSLRDALERADVLMVTDFRSTILQEAWPHARHLQWVHATSAGVDALMFPELVESDVPVTNARGIFDRAIAEFVLGLILAFAKDLPASLKLQREHRWQHRDTERVTDKTVLVVGAGAIGRSVARMVRAAGMQTLALARRARAHDPDFERVYAAESLHTALPRADFVVIAAPLTEATRGLFGQAAFHRMKRSARLINVGRGPVVETGALVQALRDGELAGAALDVFEQEPLPDDHPLWGLDNVILTAHMAGDFIGWREALSTQFLENFRRWEEGRSLENVVDKTRGYVVDQPERRHA